MFVKPRIIIVLLFSITISHSQDYRNVDDIKEKISVDYNNIINF